MVNNSTNINKMNNHLSPKERLNSDGHNWTETKHKKEKKRPQDVTLEIQIPAWDKHKNVAGLNWLMGSQPPLDSV